MDNIQATSLPILSPQERDIFKQQGLILPYIEVYARITTGTNSYTVTRYDVPAKIAGAFEQAITIPAKEERDETIADMSIQLAKKRHYIEAYAMISTVLSSSKSATRALQKLFSKMTHDKRLANEELLTRKIEQSSGDVDEAWLLIGKKFLKIGESDKASLFFNKIHCVKYRNEAWALDAVAHAKSGNLAAARGYRGLIRDPDAQAQLDVSLVEVLAEYGMFPEAMDICNGLMDKEPKKTYRTNALLLIARALTVCGKTPQAYALAQKEAHSPNLRNRILAAIFDVLISRNLNNDLIDEFIKMATALPDCDLEQSIYELVMRKLVEAKLFDKAYSLITQFNQNVFGTMITFTGFLYAIHLRSIAAHMLRANKKTVDQMNAEIPCPKAIHPGDFKSTLIQALIDVGHFDEAKTRIKLWCDTSQDRTGIARAFAEAKQIKEAHDMISLPSVISKNDVAVSIVDELCEEHKFDEALSFLHEIREWPDVRAISLFERIVVSIAKVDLYKAVKVVMEIGRAYYHEKQEIASILCRIASERIDLGDFQGASQTLTLRDFSDLPDLASPLLRQIAAGMTKACLAGK